MFGNTCFVLGAGFSAPAGVPMQSRLLQNILKPEYEREAKYIQDIFALKKRNEILKDIALEDVFTFLDKIIMRNGSAADFDLPGAYKAKRDIINYFVKELNIKLKEMRCEHKYESFFTSIAHRNINGENNSIVTFNWDTIPDFYINRAFKFLGPNNGVDYCCYDWDFHSPEPQKRGNRVPSIQRKVKGFKTVKLMKPHGSINWVFKKDLEGLLVKDQLDNYPCGLVIEGKEVETYEHVLMTPTFIKDLTHQHTQSIWQNVSFDITEASRIVFLGCSLPLSDYEFRNLLLKTAVRNKNKKIRVILYEKSPLQEKNETRKRFQTLFPDNNLKFEETDTASFLTDKEMIWEW